MMAAADMNVPITRASVLKRRRPATIIKNVVPLYPAMRRRLDRLAYRGPSRGVNNGIQPRRRGAVLDKGKELGLDQPMDLRTELSRHQIVLRLVANCEADDLNGAQKNEMAARLANLLDLDYDELVAKRLLQLMSPE